MGQFGSHRMKLRDATSWLPNHLARVRRLGPALGPNLVQLPPRWVRDVGRLDEFLSVTPPDLRWAVEIRDPSWLHDDVYQTLADHDAALCIHDLLPDVPWIRTTSWTYVRFHGPSAQTRPYHGRYTARRLRPVAERLTTWLGEGADVYAYFNNDQGASAVPDARWLSSALGSPNEPPSIESSSP